MAKRPRSPIDSPDGLRMYACNVVDCRRAFRTLQGLRLHKSLSQSANHKTARQQQSFSDCHYDSDQEDIRGNEARSPEPSEPMHEQPNSRSPSPSPSVSSHGSSPTRVRKRPRVTVEEVEDEDVPPERTASPDERDPPPLRVEIDGLPHDSSIWVESLGDDEDLQAGKTYGRCQTTYGKYEARLAAAGFDPAVRPWAVFENEVESEIGLWLAGASNLSHGGIDEFLKLPAIRQHLPLSYKDKRSFFKKIDQIPRGPGWARRTIPVKGDSTNAQGERIVVELELWQRSPLECIRELMGNPAFKKCMRYAPERHFADSDSTEGGLEEVFGEMWSARLWQELQRRLPKGATVAPVIIASDETHLTNGHGDKSAWPVYLSIGNIAKATRREVSSGATVLIGYLPVSDYEFCRKENRRRAERRTFHQGMRMLLESLVEAGKNGVMMDCADGFVRWVFPILAAYIADYPEQRLVTCTEANWCPRCTVHKSCTGDPVEEDVVMRDPSSTLEAILLERSGIPSVKAEAEGIETLAVPFWSDLLLCDIFESITPDLLHQIYNGIFKHIVKWTTACLPGRTADDRGKDLDLRFINMPKYRGLRHFARGTSFVTQWTGDEMKEMERVFLGAIAEASDPELLKAVRAVLDMTFYASFRIHTEQSVQMLAEAWAAFHDTKEVFIKKNARKRKNFKWIPKLHMPAHYPSSIYRHGTLDGYNTELPERLHIDYAKKAYRASNKKDYEPQMVQWLERHEACHQLELYLQWRHPGFYRGITARKRQRSMEEGASNDISEVEHEIDKEYQPEGGDHEFETGPSHDEQTGLLARQHRTIHTLPSHPHHPALTANIIATRFGADDFAHHVQGYLSVLPADRAGHGAWDVLLNPATTFAVYTLSRLTHLLIRQVAEVPTRETIHASSPSHAPRRSRAELNEVSGADTLADPFYFSTVLVKVPPDIADENPSAHLMNGLRVGQVRTIFRLPPEFAPHDNTPLAYIQWFTSFRVYDDVLGMWSVRPSFQMGSRRASIVPLQSIIRSCHLIPESLRNLTEVSERERSFFVNPYITPADFLLLRHLPNRASQN